MVKRAYYTLLWILTLVGCHRPGRGETKPPPEKLTIVEPLNQSPYTVEIGGEIRIKCIATGFMNEITAYWEKFGGPGNVKPITSLYSPAPEETEKYEVNFGTSGLAFSSSGDEIVDEFYLTIKDIAYEDEGGYNCYTFYGGKKIEATLLLKVDGPPIVKLIESFISVQEGSNVNLSCHYLAKPRPLNSSYWAFNGLEIRTLYSTKYIPFLRSIPSFMMGYGEFRLTIKSVVTADSGNYTCVVENYFGQAFGTVHLRVTQSMLETVTYPGSPSITQTITKLYPASNSLTSNLNTEFKIICSTAEFVDQPNMTWIILGKAGNTLNLKSDEEVMNSDVTIKTFSTQNRTGCFYTLYIDRLHFSNSGTYVCKATNGRGGIVLDFVNLTVSGTPIVESTDFVLNATLGQTVSMKCDIWSYPMPYHTAWYLENQILSSNSRYKTTIEILNPIEQQAILTISSIQENDFGVYACRAFNSRGSAMAIHIIQDVDECSFNPPCNHGCENNLGSFKCLCDVGYTLANGSLTYCEDANECMLETASCDQVCTNENGSYTCSCKDGYTMDMQGNCNNDMDNNSGEDETNDEELSVEISPETLYTVIGVCAGGLLAIILLILAAVYCRKKNTREEELGNYKGVFNTNVAYEPSIEKDHSNLNLYMSNLKNASLKDEFQRQNLQLGIDLGQGRFGKVMMARALNISGTGNWEMVAVKTCRDSASDCEKEDLIQELDIMRKIPKHKNIVAYLGCCTKQVPVYILMEYVKGGNLQVYLRKCRPSQQATTSEEITPPNAKDLKMIAVQIARGMSHIHTCGIIHRDLSARNILMTPNFSCKICDFGLSRDVEGCDVYERSSKGPLPIRWMSPESLADQMFTKKSDIWSYGVLLWEIVTLGATPYPGMAAREVIQDVTMGKWLQKPLHCKQELYLMMTRCWGFEASIRPSFKEIVCDMEALISQEAEYIEFNTYQEDKYNVLENTSDERV